MIEIGIIVLVLLLALPKSLNLITKKDTMVGTSGKGINSYCKINNIDSGFLNKINKLAKIALVKFKFKFKDNITSGYRCLEYNRYLKSIGYSTNDTSSHVKGLALDVVMDKAMAKNLLPFIKEIGIYRCLYHSGHLHLDDDKTKVQVYNV